MANIFGDEEISAEIEDFFYEEKEAPGIEPEPEKPLDEKVKTSFDSAIQTIRDISSLYPVAETAAQMATAAYGVPISGLAALFALPTGVEKAEEVLGKTQEALIYQPKTEAGRRLSEAAAYPMTQYERGAELAGKKIEEFGYPAAGAIVETGIKAAPVLLGAKAALRKPSAMLDKKTELAIKKGINKAVRPSVFGKASSSQVNRYHKNARIAVEEIIKNKENLNLVDEYGRKTDRLPQNLDQFSQAIEQTKRNIFNEYDTLAKGADVTINLNKTANRLKPVLKNKNLQDFSPETIAYAEKRMESLSGREKYTAIEAQDATQLLNQSLEKFYRDPSPTTKGQALVDSLIANDLREQLNSTITKSKGKNYTKLKRKYGALKTIEKDVVHRSIVDARRNIKGLIDFSDIMSGHQIIKGMAMKDPATLAAGTAAKGISKYYKMLNDPNRIVKNMFAEVEKLSIK